MNMIVIKQAQQLAKDIRSSEEYQSFLAIKKTLSEDAELYEKINAVRRDYFQALNGRTTEEIQNAVNGVEEKYSQLLSNGSIREFLEKEQRFCMMMQSIYEILDNAVNFDMEFLFERG